MTRRGWVLLGLLGLLVIVAGVALGVDIASEKRNERRLAALAEQVARQQAAVVPTARATIQPRYPRAPSKLPTVPADGRAELGLDATAIDAVGFRGAAAGGAVRRPRAIPGRDRWRSARGSAEGVLDPRRARRLRLG